jgi:hypothetical protein
MDVSKTTPAASTTGRRGRRNYRAVYGAKLRSPEKAPTVSSHNGRDKAWLVLVGGVGEQGDVTRALERDREAPLVPSAGARDATRKDLASLADEAAEARNLLVVDEMDLLHTEVANLLMRLAVSLIGRWWHGV